MGKLDKQGLAELKRIFGERNVKEVGDNYRILVSNYTPVTSENDTMEPPSAPETLSSYIAETLNTLAHILQSAFSPSGFKPEITQRTGEGENGTKNHYFFIRKDYIENTRAIASLTQISPQNFVSGPEYKTDGDESHADRKNEATALHYLNQASGADGVKWKIIETESGRTATTLQPVADPRTVIRALALLLDVNDLILPPPGPGLPTIPVKVLDRNDIASKFRGLDLSKPLRSATAERSVRP